MILFDNCRFLITTPNPDGVIEGGWVLVDGPTIHSVGRPEASPKADLSAQGAEVVDCSGKLVMPGMIDSHNHLANYPYNLLPGIDLRRWTSGAYRSVWRSSYGLPTRGPPTRAPTT